MSGTVEHVHTPDCGHQHENVDGSFVLNLTVLNDHGQACYGCGRKVELDSVLKKQCHNQLLIAFTNDEVHVKSDAITSMPGYSDFESEWISKLEEVEKSIGRKISYSARLIEAHFFIERYGSCVHCNNTLFLNAGSSISRQNKIEDYRKLPVLAQYRDQLVSKMYKYFGFLNLEALSYQQLDRDIKHWDGFVVEQDPLDRAYYLVIQPINHNSSNVVATKMYQMLQKYWSSFYEGKAVDAATKQNVYYNSTIDFYNIDHKLYQGYAGYLLLDIDGTSTQKALKDKYNLSKLSFHFFSILRKLEQKKLLKTIITTGRPIEWACIYMFDAGLKPLIVASNGHSVGYFRKPYDHARSTMHFQKNIASKIFDIFQTFSVKYNLKLPVWLPEKSGAIEVMIHKSDLKGLSAKDLESWMNCDFEVRSALLSNGLGRIVCTDNGQDLVNIHSSNVSKASCVKQMVHALDIPRQRVMNVGNCYNDMCLKDVSGYVCSVNNAEQNYKDVSDYVSKFDESKGALDSIKTFLVDKLKACSPDEYADVIAQCESSTHVELKHLRDSL